VIGVLVYQRCCIRQHTRLKAAAVVVKIENDKKIGIVHANGVKKGFFVHGPFHSDELTYEFYRTPQLTKIEGAWKGEKEKEK